MLIKEVKNFVAGLVTKTEASSLPDGASADNKNWLTRGDKIELRRGSYLLGTEQTGTGKVTGLHSGRMSNGTEILYRTRGKKLEYFDETTDDWVEVGSDLLSTAADGEEVAFADYNSLAGSQMWFNSPNSSLYKIMLANPASYTDMYSSTINFKGKILIKQNRMWLWDRVKDKTGIYGSHIDTGTSTTVTNEDLDTGDGGKVYSGTLAFKAGGATRTCFGLLVKDEDSIETFTDNYDGTLTGSAGGTGTINYTSGAVAVTFAANVAVGKHIYATYYWEDSNANGISDFTKSATRVEGEGFVFRQDDGGGNARTIMTYHDTEYCFHEFKTWALTLTADDTNATNLIYRERAGIPNWRAAVATGEGIYYIDDSDNNDPHFRLLTLQADGTAIIPVEVSINLDLSNYRFDQAAAIEWGDYILFACRHKNATNNNRIFAYNKLWKAWDMLETFASCFAIYGGVLHIGDSVSNNVYQLFSGWDDDESTVDNYWVANLTKLEMDNLKKLKRLVIQGEIARDQNIEVYISYDRGSFTLIDTIEGTGDYVDFGTAVTVGSVILGSKEVGGGGGDAVAYNYKKQITINSDKFQEIQLKFVATDIGYASITNLQYKDIRKKELRLPTKYRS